MEKFRSPGTKVPGTFVPGPFRSQELSFPGNESSWELSFLRLFYEALAMNADSYSTCQNLFRSRPNVCFPENKLSKLKVCSCCFFLLNRNTK